MQAIRRLLFPLLLAALTVAGALPAWAQTQASGPTHDTTLGATLASTPLATPVQAPASPAPPAGTPPAQAAPPQQSVPAPSSPSFNPAAPGRSNPPPNPLGGYQCERSRPTS